MPGQGGIFRGLYGWLCLSLCLIPAPACALPVASYAVTEQPVFQHFGVRDGLPSNSVQALAQDAEGYIWVGTNQGLARFDGLRFRNLRLDTDHEPKFGSNLFQTLHVDGRGRRWAAPENGGLVEFSSTPEILRHFVYPLLPDDSIWALADDCDGGLLLGYFKSGLLRFDPDSPASPEPVPGVPEVPITSVVTDGCDIWVGTYQNGVYHLVPDGEIHNYRQLPDSDEPLTVLTLAMTPSGLVVGARDDLLLIDRQRTITRLGERPGFPEGRVSVTGIVAESGTRLLLSTNAGLVSMDIEATGSGPAAVSFEPVSDSQNAGEIRGRSVFSHLMQDRDGAIWVGTFSQGLLYYQPDYWNGRRLNFELPVDSRRQEDRIRAISAQGPGLFLASLDRGISYLDLQNMQLLAWPEPFSRQRFHSLKTISDSELWLGSASGLFRVRHDQGVPLGPPEPISLGERDPGFIADLAAADDRRVWVVDQGTGLWLLNTAGDVLWSMNTESGLPTRYYNGIEVDESGAAWAFGDRGVIQLQVDHGGQVQVSQPAGLPERTVLDMEIAGGELWLAQSEGIHRFFNDGRRWQSDGFWPIRYRDTQLIPQALERDDRGNIWIGTLAGLGLLKSGADGILMLERPVDTIGQQIRRQSLLFKADGEMLVGSQDGLLRLTPEHMPGPDRRAPRLSLLSTPGHRFKLPSATGGHLSISHDDQPAVIQVSPMHQPGFREQRPQLQLQGYAQDWQPLGPDWELSLPDLAPGRYQLHLAGPGDYAAQSTTLVIRPPVLTAPPVKGVVTLGIALLAFWFGRGLRLAHRRRQLLRLSRQAESAARSQVRTTSAITASLSTAHIAQTLVDRCRMLQGVHGALLRVHQGAGESIPEAVCLPDTDLLDEMGAAVDEWLNLSRPLPELTGERLEAATHSRIGSWWLYAWPLMVAGRNRGWLVLIAPDILQNDVLLRVSSMLKVAATAFDNARLYRRSVAFAEEADQAVVHNLRWVAMVSHEIRSPLHGLMATLDGLSGDFRKDESADAIRVLEETSQQMLRLVDEVLVQESGPQRQFAIHPAVFNLRELTEQLVQRFAGLSAEKGLIVYRIYAADLPSHILADRVRLDQVLSNLLNNALKFTESGHVILAVKPGVLPGVIHFSVSDTGPGIAREELDVIQEPYRRGSRNPGISGVGLGLSIVRDLLQAMGTRLHVGSDPGQGSVFEFSLPGTIVDDSFAETVPVLLSARPVSVMVRQPLMRVLSGLLEYLNCQWRSIDVLSAAGPGDILLVDLSLIPLPQVLLEERPEGVILFHGPASEPVPEGWRSLRHPVTESGLAQALLEVIFSSQLDQLE